VQTHTPAFPLSLQRGFSALLHSHNPRCSFLGVRGRELNDKWDDKGAGAVFFLEQVGGSCADMAAASLVCGRCLMQLCVAVVLEVQRHAHVSQQGTGVQTPAGQCMPWPCPQSIDQLLGSCLRPPASTVQEMSDAVTGEEECRPVLAGTYAVL